MKRPQRGAALLLAMLTVTLVATLAAGALWQHWRSVEVEGAERQRQQMAWMLQGALDWARLILIEDARAGGADHLSEPWSVPLREARLSSFLSADANADAQTLQAFLSGQISDAQSMLNLASLVQGGKPHAPTVQAFARLFQQLRLPPQELDRLVLAWSRAQAGAVGPQAGSASALLRPQRMDQLGWLGVNAQVLQALQPYVVLLPEPTPVNLNTAAAPVLYAVLPEVDASRVQMLLERRGAGHFRTVADAFDAAGLAPRGTDNGLQAVSSRFFLVRGQLRLDAALVQELSLIERQGTQALVRWRQRELPVLAVAGDKGPGADAGARVASLQ